MANKRAILKAGPYLARRNKLVAESEKVEAALASAEARWDAEDYSEKYSDALSGYQDGFRDGMAYANYVNRS
ncbi:hypothetical protein [Nocardioides jensenii]|uniref:hypothetical protein n=1 Tax=Nocardioides jensenii TaxID=1843 RepID=UPI000AA8B03C|nr:hypothetical protein [Nocardioides jensenii]